MRPLLAALALGLAVDLVAPYTLALFTPAFAAVDCAGKRVVKKKRAAKRPRVTAPPAVVADEPLPRVVALPDAAIANPADPISTLFASACGWCHVDGGRAAGRGPRLQGSGLTDAEITARIRAGKPGQMPAYAEMLDAEQIQAIVGYIRAL
jgi:mono/diheme cytochrome c family protein